MSRGWVVEREIAGNKDSACSIMRTVMLPLKEWVSAITSVKNSANPADNRD